MTPMIVEHPLLQHKISLLRNKQTGTKESVTSVSEWSPPCCATRLPATCPWRRSRSRPLSPWQRPRCWQAASWPWSPSCGLAWACWTVC